MFDYYWQIGSSHREDRRLKTWGIGETNCLVAPMPHARYHEISSTAGWHEALPWKRKLVDDCDDLIASFVIRQHEKKQRRNNKEACIPSWLASLWKAK